MVVVEMTKSAEGRVIFRIFHHPVFGELNKDLRCIEFENISEWKCSLMPTRARARGMSNCKLTDRGLPCNEIALGGLAKRGRGTQ